MNQKLHRWQRLLRLYERLRDQAFARLSQQVALRENLQGQVQALDRDFCTWSLGAGPLTGQELLALAETEHQYLLRRADLKRALDLSQEQETLLRRAWQSREQNCAQLRRLVTRQGAIAEELVQRQEQGFFDELAGRAHG